MIIVRIQQGDQIEQRLNVLGQRIGLSWDFGTECEVTVRPYQDKRTKAQNRLYWKWLQLIAEHVSTGINVYSKDDMHDLLRHKFLGTEEVQIGTEVITRLPSTTKLQRAEMAQYMNRVEAWSTDMGLLLPIPAENEYAKYREAMQ
jgi:hypothetical protein